MRFTDVAIPALASGLVLAKPIEKRQTGASTVQSVGSYSYVGCAIEPFANGGNGRTLTNTSQSANTMTVESCASFCSDYAYFSVEWSSECYCGDEISSGTAIEADDTNCNFPCAGDSTEFCGGSAHQNLYSGPRASGNGLVTSSSVSSAAASSPSTSSAVVVSSSTPVSTSVSTTVAATTSTTSAVASGNAYKYVTCAVEPFQNGVEGRSLIDAATSDDSMTVEYCASYCAGYTFFAVEYSSQCYCGNKIQTGTTQDVGDHCNMPCSGNSLQQCGGAGVMNLYEVSSGPAVTLPTTYSVAKSTSSSVASTSASTSAAASTSASTSAAASTSKSSSAVASTSASTSAAANTSKSSSAVVSTSASTSAAASTSKSSSAVVSTSASTSAAASTSKSSSAVASTSASTSAAASTSKSSSAVASTSASTSAAASTSKSSSAVVSTSTTKASTAAPASTSSVTSSRAASSTASTFVTSATKASTTATATASATPNSSFFSIATCPQLSANLGLLNIKQTFTPYFVGYGVTENCINPGNSLLAPARTFQIAGTNNACAAAALCLNQMENLLVSYQSFDLHYRTDTSSWECVAYKGNNILGLFFNVPSRAVSVAYGFNGVVSF